MSISIEAPRVGRSHIERVGTRNPFEDSGLADLTIKRDMGLALTRQARAARKAARKEAVKKAVTPIVELFVGKPTDPINHLSTPSRFTTPAERRSAALATKQPLPKPEPNTTISRERLTLAERLPRRTYVKLYRA